MRVLIVNYAVGGFAGDYGQMLLVARGLQDLGHHVTVVVTDGDGFYFDKEKSKLYSAVRKKLLDAKGKSVEISGVSVYPIHCVTPKMGWYCPTATKIAKKIIKDYDIVYAINWYHHLAMVFSKISYEYGIPFVIGAMGSLQEKARRMKNMQKRIADKLYTKNMISYASGFHSIGNSETSEYIKLGADPSKIYLIDNAIAVPEALNSKSKKRTHILEKILTDVKKQQYLLYVGRIDPKKGLDILLNAFSRLVKIHNNLILIIAGTGIEAYVQKIKQMTRDLGLDDFVKFTGYVTEDEKLDLLESAKLFVVTSHSDVRTTAALEALAMSVPVVITKASDFPEIDQYQAGVTVDTDATAVYNALVRMLENESNLLEFSQNAKRLVKDKFSIEDKIKRYEQMFLDVIAKHEQMRQHIT